MKKKHILVIEDDEAIQAVTRFSLEMERNWKVTSALQGKEGIIKAKSLHPDVILLDLVMPDIKGINLIEELQSDRITKAIPIILFTAKPIKNELFNLHNSNIIGAIAKPFDCLTLSTKIMNIMNKHEIY